MHAAIMHKAVTLMSCWQRQGLAERWLGYAHSHHPLLLPAHLPDLQEVSPEDQEEVAVDGGGAAEDQDYSFRGGLEALVFVVPELAELN